MKDLALAREMFQVIVDKLIIAEKNWEKIDNIEKSHIILSAMRQTVPATEMLKNMMQDIL